MNPALHAWGNFVVRKISELVALELGKERATFFKVQPSYRVKDKASAIKKQLKKKYAEPREDMTDLVGSRFVVLLRTEIDVIERVLVAYPGWVRSKDRDPQIERNAAPNIFDYQSVHYVIRNVEEIQEAGVTIPAHLACEVQIRTLLQHAYAELVHDNFYKGEGHIPASAERLVARSMALMETTDEMFLHAVGELTRVNQTREQWCGALDGAVGPLLAGFIPTANDEDALTILEQYRHLLDQANVQEVIAGLNPAVVRKVKDLAPGGGLFAKPIVLLVYWLVQNHGFEIGLNWPVPGLSGGLAQVKAHLGVG